MMGKDHEQGNIDLTAVTRLYRLLGRCNAIRQRFRAELCVDISKYNRQVAGIGFGLCLVVTSFHVAIAQPLDESSSLLRFDSRG